MKRISHRQRGMTLIELLVGLLITGVLVGVVIGFVFSVTRFLKFNTERGNMLRSAQQIKDLVSDDLNTAGKALSVSDQLLVRDAGNIARPAVWLTDGGKTLNVVGTSPATTGYVVAGSGATSTAVVVGGVELPRWTALEPGSLIVFDNGAGQAPALYGVVSRPRQATAGDVAAVGGRRNLDRTAYVVLGPVPGCFPIRSLTTAVAPGALAVPVIRVVKYDAGEYGLTRTELVTCGGTRLGGEITPLTPGMETAHRFGYVTTRGRTTTAPVDLRELRGISLGLTLTDPKLRIKEEFDYEEYVSTWR